MNLIDRMFVRSYLKAYLVCLVSLLSLYIVVDLFTNLEEFTDQHPGLMGAVRHIVVYYAIKVTQIFDRLAEPIALIAATFTVAWAQRSNEMLPLLSAGVSTRRVVRPVVLTACLMLGLSILNQEFVIPQFASELMNDRSDPESDKDLVIQGAYEPNGIHIEGRLASRKNKIVKDEFNVVIPENIAGSVINLSAREGRYVPPGVESRSGGWYLLETTPPVLDNWNHPVLDMVNPGCYFLHVTEVDFDTLTRSRNWFNFASTSRLREELCRPESTRLAAMAVLFHMRLTRPILGMILVLSGLSIILRDQNRNVIISSGLCLVLCGTFFAAQFVCKSLADSEYISPALAAWMPVLFFGPLSLSMFDAVHT